jgi:hypothetical protein
MEGVPRIIYRRRRGEEDEKQVIFEFNEKTDSISRNWVALFVLLIVIAGVISLLDSGYHVLWASWDRLWPLLVIVFRLFKMWNVLKARERPQRPY